MLTLPLNNHYMFLRRHIQLDQFRKRIIMAQERLKEVQACHALTQRTNRLSHADPSRARARQVSSSNNAQDMENIPEAASAPPHQGSLLTDTECVETNSKRWQVEEASIQDLISKTQLPHGFTQETRVQESESAQHVIV